MNSIRLILRSLLVATAGLMLSANALAEDGSKANKGAHRGFNAVGFSFGVIADCQYCDVQGTGARKYALSKSKLEKCVTHFNSMNLKYVIQLGDLIDRDSKSLGVVGPIYAQLNMPAYHLLGNHDFSVSDEKKQDVPRKMGMPSRYYDFQVEHWRFVVLDGNDISFHAYPKGSKEQEEAAEYYKQHKITSPKWNGAIGAEQLAWLKKVLEKATTRGERVILFCHFPLFPKNVHNLWNAEEVIELIEDYSCVKAYINGHNHGGNYAAKEGIHYLTLKGMVDSEQTSYAVINVKGNHLEVIGHGREEDRIMETRK